jgi:hypothetical protein
MKCILDCLTNSCLNTLSALLYESIRRANQEKIKNSGKMPSLDLTDLISVLLHRVANPRKLPRSSWWSAPPSTGPYTCTTTDIAFGHSTLKGVGAALVPFP